MVVKESCVPWDFQNAVMCFDSLSCMFIYKVAYKLPSEKSLIHGVMISEVCNFPSLEDLPFHITE